MPRTREAMKAVIGCLLAAGPWIPGLDAQETPVVLAHTAEKGRLERVVRQSAALYPFEEVTVYAKVTGYAREVRVDLGDRVEAGQVVAVLDLPGEEAELLARQAEVKTADAQVKRSSAGLTLKQAVLELTKSLFISSTEFMP